MFHNVKSDNMVFSKTIVLNINVCGLFFTTSQWINEMRNEKISYFIPLNLVRLIISLFYFHKNLIFTKQTGKE